MAIYWQTRMIMWEKWSSPDHNILIVRLNIIILHDLFYFIKFTFHFDIAILNWTTDKNNYIIKENITRYQLSRLQIFSQMTMEVITDNWPLLCTWQANWAERPPKAMEWSERWNTLQICRRRDSNSGGSDLWSSALPTHNGGHTLSTLFAYFFPFCPTHKLRL